MTAPLPRPDINALVDQLVSDLRLEISVPSVGPRSAPLLKGQRAILRKAITSALQAEREYLACEVQRIGYRHANESKRSQQRHRSRRVVQFCVKFIRGEYVEPHPVQEPPYAPSP